MTLLYIALSALLCIAYVLLILFVGRQWTAVPIYKAPSRIEFDKYSLAILIPARNEALNIEACLQSVLSNDQFEKFDLEILIIDDGSTDNTVMIIEALQNPIIRVLQLKEDDPERPTNAHKKWALNKGVRTTKADYIIQTDADCILPKDYLTNVVSYINDYEPQFLAGPVMFENTGTTFQDFQVLDFTGMMALTQVGIKTGLWYMANGANMVYKREAFKHDYSGLASGDDVYGIQSVAKHSKSSIHFLKASPVVTKAEKDLSGFINQRLRWSTKNKFMKNVLFVMVMVIPYLFCLSLIVHLTLIPFWGKLAVQIFIITLLVKTVSDYFYLKALAKFFKNHSSFKSYVQSQMLHIIYIIVIGTMSLFVRKYTWKGRRVE